MTIKALDRSWVEPLLRFAVTGIRLSMDYLGRVPNPPENAFALLDEAIEVIFEWANEQGVEIRRSMRT